MASVLVHFRSDFPELKKSRLPLVLFLLLLSIAGCSGGKKESEQQPQKQFKDTYPMPADALVVAVRGHRGGRIISASFVDPKTFNPILGHETDSQTYNELMTPRLTRLT